ncbi:MAG TPA: flagellar motor switch protein FliG [Anaeromyxobacter sp.]|nr:flagellar motor switch protein FliG [Anaeromyxobacter sp.]
MPDAAPPPSALIDSSAIGCQRAAAVLLGIGPDVATTVFKALGEPELRRIALGAKELRTRGPQVMSEALEHFVTTMESVAGDAAAGDDLLRQVAERALGADAARRAFDGVVPPPPPDEVLGPVSQADPEALSMVLQREQAQTIALVLSSLESSRAASVLDRLPEKLRPDVLRRMATIESVAPEVLREVGQALSSELKALVAGGMRRVDGKSTALEILRRTHPQAQGVVLAEIERDDAQLASELRGRLFTFGDLVHLADRDLQQLLREIDAQRLTVALKGATADVRQKFLHNLSTRAAEMLSDDLAAMGPVKLSSVEAAQQEIAKTAQELASQGRITIVGPSEKML